MATSAQQERWALLWAGAVVGLASMLALAAVWFIWIDKTMLAPPSGGTAIVLPQNVVLGQNREVLFDNKTGVLYSRAVRKYAVVGDLIVGEEEGGWFILDLRDKVVQHFCAKSSYEGGLRAAGIRDSPTLRSP